MVNITLNIWTAAEAGETEDPWSFQVPTDWVPGILDCLAEGSGCIKLQGKSGNWVYFPVRNILAVSVVE